MSTPSRGRIRTTASMARSPVSARLACLIGALTLLPDGCVLPHTLSWEIGWSEAGLEDRAASVEASILKDGCDGGTLVWIQEVSTATARWDDPPRLGEGRYGFVARARDAHCAWFASGCRELEMPADDDGELLVIVEPLTPEQQECPAEQCIGGECSCARPGECGAACTSGDCACADGGCSMACGLGRTCSCVGGGCNVRCETGATCSCRGGHCVMDCAAGARCVCEGGDCTLACEVGADCTCPGDGCG